jgi:hypothetical protein
VNWPGAGPVVDGLQRVVSLAATSAAPAMVGDAGRAIGLDNEAFILQF